MSVSALYKLLLPLILFVVYIFGTLCISFFGPIIYNNYDKSATFLYILAFLAFFSTGYIVGTFGRPVVFNGENGLKKKRRVVNVVKACILLAILLKAIALVEFLINQGGSLSVFDVGRNYVESYRGYVRGEADHGIYYVLTVLSEPIYLIALILGFFYFKELSKIYKLLFILLLCTVVLLFTIGTGKQKQFGDILIYLCCALFVRFPNTKQKEKIKLTTFSVTSCVIGVLAICASLSLRYEAMDTDASNINDKTHPLTLYDTDHLVFGVLGKEVGFPASVFCFYLGNGYYGLSLATKEPFRWTYLRGHSYSVAVFTERYIGMSPVLEDTYPYRVGNVTGWDQSKWHSVFSWFASDLTFTGTLVLFSFIGFIYARAWKSVYQFYNPISMLLFSTLTLGLIFVPANNQLLHTPEGILSTTTFVMLWCLFHKRFNYSRTKQPVRLI